jgi:hypothetical protein
LTPDLIQRPTAEGPRRILMLCDWLPPDFGAVGQYALGFAHELAESGHEVALVGFSSAEASCTSERIGEGSLRIRRLHRPSYNRANWILRALWTLTANVALLWGARRELQGCEEIRFTGSPPYLLHFVMPVARLLRVDTRYRITDFHPECLIAALDHDGGGWLRLLSRWTNFWRRRVDVIEVLGEDQSRRLMECGVEPSRIVLRRDPSPIEIAPDTMAAVPPAGATNRRIILYSGNWGVAHDHETFIDGYTQFCRQWPAEASLWLNATGKRAEQVAVAMGSRDLPFVRTAPAPLDQLPGILCAADVHLITLDNRFVGYVMPSKVYACIASGRPILFVGSRESDVHLLCARELSPERYRQVDVGDAGAVTRAISSLLGLAGADAPSAGQ